jgi:hypothetical protein
VTGATLTEIFYEQDRLGSTLPTEEELQRAKRYQGGLYLLRNQVQTAVANTLASNWVKGLPPEALGEFVSKVNAVSAEQVRAAGRSYFPSSRLTSWSWARRRRSRKSSRRSGRRPSSAQLSDKAEVRAGNAEGRALRRRSPPSVATSALSLGA